MTPPVKCPRCGGTKLVTPEDRYTFARCLRCLYTFQIPRPASAR